MHLTPTKGTTMSDYTTADMLEDWHYSRLDADMEMAELEREARESEADRKAGNCRHNSAGVGYRETAFYPEQIGLSPGQTHCHGCGEVFASDLDCFLCGLPEWHCGGERGWSDDHTAFVMPVRVTVCNVTQK